MTLPPALRYFSATPDPRGVMRATVWIGAMPSEPLRDSAAEPGGEVVDPDASELDDGPGMSVTKTDLHHKRTGNECCHLPILTRGKSGVCRHCKSLPNIVPQDIFYPSSADHPGRPLM